MNIETANLIASAVQIALMIVFGLWVKHFIDQQIKSKDAAIQALETTIKSKDSEISRLEKDSTPAMATAYQQVRDFAAAVAQDAIDLRTKLQAAESTPNLAQDRESLTRIAGRVEGILLFTNALRKSASKLLPMESPPTAAQVTLMVMSASSQMKNAVNDMLKESEGLLKSGSK